MRLFLALAFVLSLGGTVPRLDLALTLEGAPRQVQDLRWSVGHGQLQVPSGTADRVLAGGKPVGVFFTGQGTFRYASAYTPEFPVFRHNMESNSLPVRPYGAKWEEGPGTLGFTMKIEGGLVLGMPSEFLAALPAAPGPLKAAFDAHQRKFSLEAQPGMAASYYHGKEHLLAYAAANAPGKRLALAEVMGGDYAVIHRFDDAWGQVEALDAVASTFSDQREYRWFLPLSFQPLGWVMADQPLPTYILQDVVLKLDARPEQMSDLAVDETLMPFQPMRILPLQMLNFVRRGGSKTSVRVASVKDAAGKELAFSHLGDELLVDLGRTVPADQPVKLSFAIEGMLMFNVDNFDCWKLGVEPWFPQPDIGGQFYTIRALIRVPKPYVPLAGGTTIRRQAEGNLNCLEVAFTKPVEAFTVFAGSYQVQEETQGGQLVRVAAYHNQGSGIQKLSNLAFGLIEVYTALLGPFPFREFNIIQDRSFGYGQAPPGIMIITDEAFSGQMDDLAKLFTTNVNQRFAHEIAHQYWGHALKATSWEEEWLQEAFAEYCAGEALRSIRSKGESAFEGAVARWKANAESAASVAPIALANRICIIKDPSNMESRRRYGLLYGKGPLLLQRIRERVGDADFYRFLRLLQGQFQGKFLTTTDVQKLLEAVTRQDFKAFFDQYYWGLALPPKGGR